VIKWRKSSEHCVEDATCTPDIHLFCVVGVIEHFWSRITLISLKHCAHLVGIISVQLFRYIEVGKFYCTQITQNVNIAGLNVSVANSLCVDVLDCLHYFSEKSFHYILVIFALKLGDTITQLFPFH
jgi:hypothetical protein